MRVPFGVPSLTAARTFSALVSRAAFGRERIPVLRHGRAIAAIVPMADLAALQQLDRLAGVPPAAPTPSTNPTSPRRSSAKEK